MHIFTIFMRIVNGRKKPPQKIGNPTANLCTFPNVENHRIIMYRVSAKIISIAFPLITILAPSNSCWFFFFFVYGFVDRSHEFRMYTRRNDGEKHTEMKTRPEFLPKRRTYYSYKKKNKRKSSHKGRYIICNNYIVVFFLG